MRSRLILLIFLLIPLVNAQTVVDFDNPQPPGSPFTSLNGVFQEINFGSNQWIWGSPYSPNPTNYIYLGLSNSGTLVFSTPSVLDSMNVFTTTEGTLTLSDDTGQTYSQLITVGSMQLVNTDWTQTATTITVDFTAGSDIALDEITFSAGQSCSCGSWSDDACGAGSCSSTEMQQTRACTPSACQVETQCVDDASCTAPTCGDSSCNGAETCSSCPGDCGACPPTNSTGPGDVNNDGMVDIDDLIMMTVNLGSSGFDSATDINNDGTVNIFDMVVVARNYGNDYTTTDTTPPVISNPQPTGILPAGTTSTTIQVTTDEDATCRINPGDTTYNLMGNAFETTGSTTHTINVNTFPTNDYYVRCQDTSGNSNTASTFITFTVDSSCSCGSWTNNACGAGTCTSGEMQQTRTCTPSACLAEIQCVNDASCQSCSCSGTSCHPSNNGQVCDGCNYVTAPAESCAAGDNDCDGQIDEGLSCTGTVLFESTWDTATDWSDGGLWIGESQSVFDGRLQLSNGVVQVTGTDSLNTWLLVRSNTASIPRPQNAGDIVEWTIRMRITQEGTEVNDDLTHGIGWPQMDVSPIFANLHFHTQPGRWRVAQVLSENIWFGWNSDSSTDWDRELTADVWYDIIVGFERITSNTFRPTMEVREIDGTVIASTPDFIEGENNPGSRTLDNVIGTGNWDHSMNFVGFNTGLTGQNGFVNWAEIDFVRMEVH